MALFREGDSDTGAAREACAAYAGGALWSGESYAPNQGGARPLRSSLIHDVVRAVLDLRDGRSGRAGMLREPSSGR
jgi:hypothetical protein